MSVPKHWLLGGRYHRELIVHQKRYRPSYSNNNVDLVYMMLTRYFKETLSSQMSNDGIIWNAAVKMQTEKKGYILALTPYYIIHIWTEWSNI